MGGDNSCDMFHSILPALTWMYKHEPNRIVEQYPT
jgi:hypothetical protein